MYISIISTTHFHLKKTNTHTYMFMLYLLTLFTPNPIPSAHSIHIYLYIYIIYIYIYIYACTHVQVLQTLQDDEEHASQRAANPSGSTDSSTKSTPAKLPSPHASGENGTSQDTKAGELQLGHLDVGSENASVGGLDVRSKYPQVAVPTRKIQEITNAEKLLLEGVVLSALLGTYLYICLY